MKIVEFFLVYVLDGFEFSVRREFQYDVYLEGYEVNMPWIESCLYHVHVFSCVSLFPSGLSLMSTIHHFRSYRVMDMDTMEILCQAEDSAACAHMEELIRYHAECKQEEACEDDVLLF